MHLTAKPAAPGPTLRLKRVGLQTYTENVAFLSAKCPLFKPDSLATLNKVEIAGANGRRITASLNIAEDGELVDAETLGLSIPAFEDLGEAEGSMIGLRIATPPRSLDSLRRKIAGDSVGREALAGIIGDIAAHRYSRSEIAAFLVASSTSVSADEVLDLTKAMASVGTRIDWASGTGQIFDKHCVGGIPGNRTSMIVVPIVAACGLPIPKTSSRAITSPAGTADTMEVLARVDLSIAEMKTVVSREHGCLAWGGHVNLSPADDVLISVERPLGIDLPQQLVASILSKKLAAGSTHVLIDIPIGATAKVRRMRDAHRMRALFEYVGANLGLVVKVVVTDGSQPIGRGVGPMLEARDVMAVLRNEPAAPPDLRERALFLAGHILEFQPGRNPGDGLIEAQRALESGAALASMERIIAAQGPPPQAAKLGSIAAEILAPVSGKIHRIDCHRISRIACLAGAPASKGAGVDLLKKIGDCVTSGEPLYRIHAAAATDFGYAMDSAREMSGYVIGGP